jgi:S1-C subfamily serine protease
MLKFPYSLAVAALLSLANPAAADNSEDIFKEALGYTVQIKTAVPVPFEHDKKGSSRGAGFLVDAERGWVMTNAHVVARSPSRIEVAFNGDEFAEGEKLYVDPHLDLAVVGVGDRARKLGLTPPPLDCSALPAVGHPVGAFGHPWNLRFTGTRGIISGVTSKYETEALQTDAPINQGNSGGPLISLRDGRIVGINTASIVERGAQNTNFAVAMKYACRVLELLREGRDPSPPHLPVVFFRDLDDRKQLRVARNYIESSELKLEPGDIVLEVVGVEGRIQNETQLIHALRGRLDGFQVKVQRGPQVLTLPGRLTPAPRVTGQRGVFFSGILLGEIDVKDVKSLPLSRVMVHSVERGSIAEFNDVEKNDVLDAVDGKPVGTLDGVMEQLQAAHRAGRPVTLAFKRLSGGDALFHYLERSLRVTGLGWIGPEQGR